MESRPLGPKALGPSAAQAQVARMTGQSCAEDAIQRAVFDHMGAPGAPGLVAGIQRAMALIEP